MLIIEWVMNKYNRKIRSTPQWHHEYNKDNKIRLALIILVKEYNRYQYLEFYMNKWYNPSKYKKIYNKKLRINIK